MLAGDTLHKDLTEASGEKFVRDICKQ
jgi:hypothetical protein